MYLRTFTLCLGIALAASPAMQTVAGDASPADNGTPLRASDQAYREPLPGLTPAELDLFEEGRKGFAQHWAVAPSILGLWGRGPTSNGEACTDCHVNGGRGRASDDGRYSVRVRMHCEPLPSLPSTSPP